MTEIVPAILPASYNDLASHIARVHGLVPRVQIDIANGSYAPTKTWPYTSKEHFRELISQEEGLPHWDEVDYETDMLITKPEEIISEWTDIGISAAIIHIESTEKLQECIAMAKERSIEIGFGVKPGTPLERLLPYLSEIDFVQCMGSDTIGHHGVILDERVYEKIKEIRKENSDIPIAVDIGVTFDTAPKLIAVGATKLVSGSAIFKNPDITEAVQYFESL